MDLGPSWHSLTWKDTKVRGDLVPDTLREVRNIRKFITRQGGFWMLLVSMMSAAKMIDHASFGKNDELWKEQDLGREGDASWRLRKVCIAARTRR